MEDKREWLVFKRGLYWRPNDCGYTGIRDHAALYTKAEAEERTQDDACAMVHLSVAPEFTSACYDDLARDHLTKQRDAAQATIAALQSEVDRLTKLIAQLMGDDESMPRYTTKRLRYEVEQRTAALQSENARMQGALEAIQTGRRRGYVEVSERVGHMIDAALDPDVTRINIPSQPKL